MPKDAGKPVDLTLAVEFGVCREICIPAEAKFSLTLPPVACSGQAARRRSLAALERVPRPPASRRAERPAARAGDGDPRRRAPHLTIEARFPPGSRGADLFIEAPDGLYVPLAQAPCRDGSRTDTQRFEVDLSRGDNARELKGKTLTLTLVSDAGATETTWTVP